MGDPLYLQAKEILSIKTQFQYKEEDIIYCQKFVYSNFLMKATLIEENEKLNRTCLKKNTDVRNDTENTLIHYVCYFYEVRNDYSKFTPIILKPNIHTSF